MATDRAAVMAALLRIRECEWTTQETCYVTLLKVLRNVMASPAEPKFRRLNTSNAVLRTKVFDVPGAAEFLRAAGFIEDAGGFVVLPQTSEAQAQVAAASAALQRQADEAQMDELRRERDQRIASAKAEEQKVNRLKLASHMTGEEAEELRRKIAQDRAEVEADHEFRPVHESKPRELKFGASEADKAYLKGSGSGSKGGG